jgi:hypothetical protein
LAQCAATLSSHSRLSETTIVCFLEYVDFRIMVLAGTKQ